MQSSTRMDGITCMLVPGTLAITTTPLRLSLSRLCVVIKMQPPNCKADKVVPTASGGCPFC